jgi:hypothetical protein
MLDHRELYGYLIDDVGVMLKRGQDQDDKLAFVSLSTDYLGSGLAGDAQAGGTAPFGRPAAPADPAAGEVAPKVKMVLEVRTTKDPAQSDRMIDDVFLNWLRTAQKLDKTDRAAYPYTIDLTAAPTFAKGGTEVLGSAKSGDPFAPQPNASPMPGVGFPSGRGGRGGGDSIGFGGGGPGGSGVPGGPAGGGNVMPGGGNFAPPPPPPQIGGNNAPDVEKLAPLPAQPPIAADGTKLSKYTITWYVSVKNGPEVKKEGGQ